MSLVFQLTEVILIRNYLHTHGSRYAYYGYKNTKDQGLKAHHISAITNIQYV